MPATVLITDVFVSHVARFAANLGHPGYHSLVVPHPAATKTDDAAGAPGSLGGSCRTGAAVVARTSPIR